MILAPQLKLAHITAYTIGMSQRAMLAQARGASQERIRAYVKEWAGGMREIIPAEIVGHHFDDVDWERPMVIMANHQSYLDVLALFSTLPTPFGVLAKKSLYRIPFFSGVMDALGCVPIDRRHRRAAVASVTQAARMVREGSTVAVFPEGTRSRGDRILPLKKGPFYLAQEAGVPVLPIGIRGAGLLMPRENTAVYPGKIEVHAGKLIGPIGKEKRDRTTLMNEVRDRLSDLTALPKMEK